MRRISLWLTVLIPVIAAAACGAGAGHLTSRIHVSPGWRIAQALPNGPGSGQPGLDMGSVAAVGAHDAWAVGYTCLPPCGTRPRRLLVEHWGGARWREIPSPPGRGMFVAPPVISASSATSAWVFADDHRAWQWNGSNWAGFRFPRDSNITAAAAFSRTDALAFGEMSGGPYVARFNGSRWLRQPSPPMLPWDVSALAPDDIWAVGPLTPPETSGDAWAAAHWNGSRWQTLRFGQLPLRFPQLHLRPGAQIGKAHIEAFSTHDAWVDIGLMMSSAEGEDLYPGIIVLHWNGRAWSRVPVPYRPLEAGDISRDGRGGIWIYAEEPWSESAGYRVDLYHYRNGQWSRQLTPTVDGSPVHVGVFSWSPGASSGWATANADNPPRGLLVRYFP